MPIQADPKEMTEVLPEMLEQIIKNGFCFLQDKKGRIKKVTWNDLYLDSEDFEKLKKIVEEEKESKKND